MTNFLDIKKHFYPQPIKQVPVPKVVYWTKKRCSLLAANFYILPEMELRKMFGGRAYGTLKAKAYKLKAKDWEFKKS
jgi:hypothetical protein